MMVSQSLFSSELADRVRAIVTASNAPLDAGAVRRQLKGEFGVKPKQQPELAALLASMEGLVEWPAANAKGAPRYWGRSLRQVAETKAIEAAAAAPVAPKKLIGIISKGKTGIAKDQAEALLFELEESGKLHRQPLLAEAKYKMTSRLTEADRDYLHRALRVIMRSLQALGEDPQFAAAPPQPQPTHDGLDELLLETLVRLEPRKGLVVTATRLRQALTGIPKPQFDNAVMRLYRAEKVLLHRHSGPHLLPPSERDELIQAGDAYYVGVCWNTGE